MARRRGDGEGKIAKRPDGRWHGRLFAGVGPDGRRRRVHVYGRTKIEALDALRRARNRLAEGRPPADDGTTVAEYLRWWAAEVLPRDTRVRDTTAYGYRRIVEHRIVPAIGRYRLARLAPAHVQDLLAELAC